MSALPRRNFLERPLPGAEELACRYTLLLDLYSEMESASDVVFQAIDSAAPAGEVAEKLQAKMAVANRILEESRGIADLKKVLSEGGGIDLEDRALVMELEERLTRAVDRMVQQENQSRDLVMRRGVKVSRR